MRILLFIFTLTFGFTSAFSQKKAFTDEHIDSTINAFKTKWRIPGISVAIAKDGKLIYAKGFGYADTAAKEPVTVNSLFRIASCSKTITAVGIMKLIQDKKLKVDDTVFGVNGILNDSLYRQFSDGRIQRITVRNLLQQTVGWDNNDVVGDNEASYALKTPYPSQPVDIIRYNLQKGLDFAPTTEYRYSNFNYLVLGEIIKKVTGGSYEDYITTEVLHPIGAYTTQPGRTRLEDKAANEVHYYDSNPDLQTSVFDTTTLVPSSYGGFNLETMHANGGWISRPIDLVKIMLSIDGTNASPDILNRETIALMTTLPDSIHSKYAMGLEVKGNKRYHAGALTWGTSALLFKDANDVCFAITCNTLATIKGTDEEMFQTMVEYVTALHRVLPEALKNIAAYPDIDLFDTFN